MYKWRNYRTIKICIIESEQWDYEKNVEHTPKTVEIELSKDEFEKLKAVRQLDRVIFLNIENKECFTVYNLVSDN